MSTNGHDSHHEQPSSPAAPPALDTITNLRDIGRKTRLDYRRTQSKWAIYSEREKLGHHKNAQVFVYTDKSTLCGRPRNLEVTINADLEAGTAHYSGLYYCGKGWRCAVCSQLLRRSKAEEIQQAAEKWLAAGNYLAMATFTIRHHKRMALLDSLNLLRDARAAMARTYGFKVWKEKTGRIGDITALEITYGRNGWHPHFHVLYFLRKPVENYDRLEFFDMWNQQVQKAGGDSLSFDAFDFQNVTKGHEQVAAYIAKTIKGVDGISSEIALADLKNGKIEGQVTPFQFLGMDEKIGRPLWDEYVDATQGKSMIRWSRGLRKILNLEPEKTDEEIVEDLQSQGEPVLELSAYLYEQILKETAFAVLLLRLVEEQDFSRLEQELKAFCDRKGLNYRYRFLKELTNEPKSDQPARPRLPRCLE